MAKADVCSREVEVKTVKEVKRVVLELTVAEARTLLSVFERIGGSPETTLRGQIDSVGKVLREAGVKAYYKPDENYECSPMHNENSRSLYFDDNSISYIQPGEDE